MGLLSGDLDAGLRRAAENRISEAIAAGLFPLAEGRRVCRRDECRCYLPASATFCRRCGLRCEGVHTGAVAELTSVLLARPRAEPPRALPKSQPTAAARGGSATGCPPRGRWNNFGRGASPGWGLANPADGADSQPPAAAAAAVPPFAADRPPPPTPPRLPPPPPPRDFVRAASHSLRPDRDVLVADRFVIDASQVSRAAGTALPRVDVLLTLVCHLLERGKGCTCVHEAPGQTLLAHRDWQLYRRLCDQFPGYFRVCPRHRRPASYILETASRQQAAVISCDQFRGHEENYPLLCDPTRLIRLVVIRDDIYLGAGQDVVVIPVAARDDCELAVRRLLGTLPTGG